MRRIAASKLALPSGQVYRGCNVENASFSLTLCAERAAAVAAIAGGDRQFKAIAVASPGGVTPCGGCRQFLAEFDDDLLVLTIDVDTRRVERFRLSALLPHAFGKSALPAASSLGDRPLGR